MTVMDIAQSLTQDMDLLDYLASASPHVMLLALMQTGSLAAITELMQSVNLMMIMAELKEPVFPTLGRLAPRSR
jgi:hypothetical protein